MTSRLFLGHIYDVLFPFLIILFQRTLIILSLEKYLWQIGALWRLLNSCLWQIWRNCWDGMMRCEYARVSTEFTGVGFEWCGRRSLGNLLLVPLHFRHKTHTRSISNSINDCFDASNIGWYQKITKQKRRKKIKKRAKLLWPPPKRGWRRGKKSRKKDLKKRKKNDLKNR